MYHAVVRRKLRRVFALGLTVAPADVRDAGPVAHACEGAACVVSALNGLREVIVEHQGIRILDEAAEAAVRLSARWIRGRQLPDKAGSLIDTACAHVAISQAVAEIVETWTGIPAGRRQSDEIGAVLNLRQAGERARARGCRPFAPWITCERCEARRRRAKH